MNATNPTVVVGTATGLDEPGRPGQRALDGRSITALSCAAGRWWALVDGKAIWSAAVDEDGAVAEWAPVARISRRRATCILPTASGLLVGTARAHLFDVRDGQVVGIAAFDEAPGRRDWYTPWGGPPDTRSLARDRTGTIYANVHVGGILRSRDDGGSWHPTLDIDADVHQVLAHPSMPGRVLAAAAIGLGMSIDSGETWSFQTEGLHATYARAVAVAGPYVFMTVSTGPAGRRSAVYRRALDGSGPFERCRRGLPQWFSGNIDTGCLAASEQTVIFGTDDGAVFRSTDFGESWNQIAAERSPIQAVALG